VGPRAVLDAVVKRKFPALARTRIPHRPARSSALYHRAIPAPLLLYRILLIISYVFQSVHISSSLIIAF
jgi:hypothetical protein